MDRSTVRALRQNAYNHTDNKQHKTSARIVQKRLGSSAVGLGSAPIAKFQIFDLEKA